MNRIAYLDTLKGICILLVVFCHYPLLPENSFIGNIIMTLAWAAVPCFMMITGNLLQRSRSFIWTKYLKRLIVTYFTIVFWKAVYYLVYHYMIPASTSTIDLVQYLFFFKPLDYIQDGVMWYMNAYLMVMLLYPVLHYLIKNNINLYLYLLFLSFFSGIVIPSLDFIAKAIFDRLINGSFSVEGVNVIFPFIQWGNMLFFFLLGGYLSNVETKIRQTIKNWIIPLVFILAGGSLLMIVKKIDSGTFLWRGIYIENGYSHFATVIMSIGLYEFFAMIKENRFLLFIGHLWGKTTMGIYYLHFLFLGVLNITLFPIWHIQGSLLVNLIKTLFISTACSAITIICRKIPVIRIFFK